MHRVAVFLVDLIVENAEIFSGKVRGACDGRWCSFRQSTEPVKNATIAHPARRVRSLCPTRNVFPPKAIC